MAANKNLMTLRTKVHEFIFNTIDTFSTIHNLTGSMTEHVMVDKQLSIFDEDVNND